MKPLSVCLCFAIIAAVPLHASAVDIVRCTTRDGEVRYQDRPCAVGEDVQTIHLVDDLPARPAPPPDAAREAAKAEPVAREPAPSTVEAVEIPSPAMPPSWLCRRDDGSRYLSDTGVGDRRAVPLAMLGVPGRSLGDAYGPNGAGVSAPGVHTPGVDRSAGAAIGTAYTWVEDPCAPAGGDEVCRFLQGETAAAEKRLRYAFSDTAAQVRAEIAALRERAAPCR